MPFEAAATEGVGGTAGVIDTCVPVDLKHLCVVSYYQTQFKTGRLPLKPS